MSNHRIDNMSFSPEEIHTLSLPVGQNTEQKGCVLAEEDCKIHNTECMKYFNSKEATVFMRLTKYLTSMIDYKYLFRNIDAIEILQRKFRVLCDEASNVYRIVNTKIASQSASETRLNLGLEPILTCINITQKHKNFLDICHDKVHSVNTEIDEKKKKNSSSGYYLIFGGVVVGVIVGIAAPYLIPALATKSVLSCAAVGAITGGTLGTVSAYYKWSKADIETLANVLKKYEPAVNRLRVALALENIPDNVLENYLRNHPLSGNWDEKDENSFGDFLAAHSTNNILANNTNNNSAEASPLNSVNNPCISITAIPQTLFSSINSINHSKDYSTTAAATSSSSSNSTSTPYVATTTTQTIINQSLTTSFSQITQNEQKHSTKKISSDLYIDCNESYQKALNGDSVAQYIVGNHCFDKAIRFEDSKDMGMANHVYKKAFRWFEKVCAGSNSSAIEIYGNAQYMLGFCYYYGKGTKQNYVQSFTHLKLAEGKNIFANLLLAKCYRYGYGVNKDSNIAKNNLSSSLMLIAKTKSNPETGRVIAEVKQSIAEIDQEEKTFKSSLQGNRN